MMIFKSYLSKLSIFGVLIISLLASCSQDDPDVPPTVTPTTSTSDFCYTLTTSVADYDTIVDGFSHNIQTGADYIPIILSFPFNFCDETFDKLYVGWNFSSTFTLDSTDGVYSFLNYELLTVGSLMLDDYWGTLPNGDPGNVSRLISQTTGAPGNRIMTIEWREFKYDNWFGEPDEEEEYIISFQIKLHENGNKISYHYGPNAFDLDFVNDQFITMAIGTYGMVNEDGALLSGDPSNPTVHTSLSPTTELTSFPAPNTVYTFE